MEPTIEEILEDRIPLVCAADQAPFDHVSRETLIADTFCPMFPLMTLDGRTFANPGMLFPKRSRVWWMLLARNRRELVIPGSLWSAEIEPARRPDKEDAYQLRRDSVEFGARGWVQILDVEQEEPDLNLVRAGAGLAHGRPTLPRVLLRGRSRISGPFLAEWRAGSGDGPGTVVLKPANLGKPEAWVADLGLLGTEVRTFRYMANQWDTAAGVHEVRLALVPDRLLAVLQQQGTRLDVSTDVQIVNWALGLAKFTGREKSGFKLALDRLPLDAAEEERVFPGRMARFRQLCQDAERVVALGEEAAQAAAAQPAFGSLIEVHAIRLAAQRVEEIVAERRERIAVELRQMEEQRDRVQKEISRLDETFARARQEQDARLKVEQMAWLAGIERREKDVAAREKALEDRQQQVEARLQRLIELYRDHGEQIGDQVLAQLPILRKAGIGAGQALAPEAPSRTAHRLPVFLDRPVPREGLSERAFLDQFARVAAGQGYVFEREDLIAFHVALKVGPWTLVAGPSGIGKSSLPRLYAEALGASDEFLSIPVRPDWLDDRDVVGGFNVLSGRFEPASTGLVDRLIAAHEDQARQRGGVYLVMLDEMNLARIEHYFAQFLSVLSEPPQRRALTLSSGVAQPDDPYTRYHRLPIGANVRFVGTVNVDETTHFFSPKVLDRFAVVTLRPPDLAQQVSAAAAPKEVSVTPVHCDEYRSWARAEGDAPAETRKLVLDLHGDLRRVRSGLGFRSFQRILEFVASAGDLLTPDRALDLALEQTMLPRLRAEHPAAAEVFRCLAEKLPVSRFPRSSGHLESLRSGEGGRDFFQLL